jgi:hypothetical protein
MKNLILITVLFIGLTSYAQAPFQGKITYSLEIRGDHDMEEEQDLPDEVVAYYKDGKMRFDVIAKKFNFHIITNEAEQDAAFMMELKDEFTMKMAIKTSKGKLQKEFDIDEAPKTHYTKERKKIAGYTCKKIIIETEDGEAYAYVTEQLNAQNLNWLFDEEVKGTMMEFVVREGDSNDGIILRAINVQKMTIADIEFEIPSDYMVVSEDGLNTMFGEDGMF